MRAGQPSSFEPGMNGDTPSAPGASVGKTGHRYRVCVIRAGLSLNDNYYPDHVLKAASRLFDGARVFVKSDRDHLSGGGKDINNLVGRIVKPTFTPGSGADTGAIFAELELIDPDGAVGRKLLLSDQRGMSDLFGLSIHASATFKAGTIGQRAARIVTDITKVHSVDLIVEPGAGGRVLDLLEAAPPHNTSAKGQGSMDRQQIIAVLKEAGIVTSNGVDIDTLPDDEILALLTSQLKTPTSAGRDGADALKKALALRDQVSRALLPPAAKRRLVAECDAGVILTEARLNARIMEEARDHKDTLRAAGVGHHNPSGLGDQYARIEVTEARSDKVAKMFDALFDPKDKSVISIKECYRETTGDTRFTGLIRNCDRVLLSEALGSESFGDVLGDALNRRMIRDYNTPDVLDVWRDMVDIVNVSDFRDQKAVRYGGYGDLPVVQERQPYDELTSPGDEAATYTVNKRGGVETVTLEMIRNDDMRAVAKIPTRMAQAAKRTLSRFVLSIPATNAAIYDTKALFHADHGNIGAAALSSAAVGAGRLAMKNQRERDSDAKLSLIAKFLWVPDDLEQVAFNLFRRDTNQDADFIQSLMLNVRPVWCWENVNDWMMTCDPSQAPFIELGFLDGREEPEIFIQDSPTSGSMFVNDTITYKIRHIFGAAVVDYRTAYKSSPAT